VVLGPGEIPYIGHLKILGKRIFGKPGQKDFGNDKKLLMFKTVGLLDLSHAA
jgi:hypothetical protein